jgi:hypothetical protein
VKNSIESKTARYQASVGLALLILFGAGIARGQESADTEEQTKIEVRITTDRPGERKLHLVITDEFDAGLWSVRLSDCDIDARENAYSELLMLSRPGTSARLALESWAVDPTVPERAWTARLALRELERNEFKAAGLHWILNRRPADPLEHSIGEPARETTPRGSIGQVAVTEALRNFELPSDAPAQVLVAPFGAPGSQSLYVRRVFTLPRLPEGIRIKAMRDFKLDIQPEGVVLLVTDRAEEGTRAFKYAAASLSILLEEHPELRHQVPGLVNLTLKPLAPGSQLHWGAGRAIFRTDGVLPSVTHREARRPVSTGPPQDILGVNCTPVSSEEGTISCLGPGVGLRIEYRVNGTIASELDLKRGDILVELCGEALCGVDEISRIMSQRQGDEVEVKIVDRTGRERTLTWAPKRTAVIQLMVEDGGE